MTSIVFDCPICGYRSRATACLHCGGSLRGLDGRDVLVVATDRPWHLWHGAREVKRALFAMLHGHEFIGRLRLPVLANAVVLLALVAAFATWLVPAFEAAFTSEWWVLDGLRRSHAQSGSAYWTCTTWLLLGPPLLDLVAGPLQEPLREATERRLLGDWRLPPPSSGALRLRDRATLLTALLLLWPACLGLVLVPWVGVPLTAAIGAAVAAVVWFEPPMAPRGFGLVDRVHRLWQHRWWCLGTGAALQVAAAVPFVNLLALAPIATIAATASWLRFAKF